MAETDLELQVHPDYHSPMAVIHISEAEAARDLPGLLAKVRAGEEIRIDSGSESFDLIRTPAREKSGKILDLIAALEKQGAMATLDPGFADDVEDGMRRHREEKRYDPWA